MTRVILNLTLPLITEAIESILECYPHHPYRELFASYEARQDLVAYILNRYPSTYIVMEPGQRGFVNLQTAPCSQQQRLQLETLVHQAIQYFAHQPAETGKEEGGVDLSCLSASCLVEA